MAEQTPDVTLDEVKERVCARRSSTSPPTVCPWCAALSNALRPIRALDSRAMRTVEPAVTLTPRAGAS